jgi:hypothetical protein
MVETGINIVWCCARARCSAVCPLSSCSSPSAVRSVICSLLSVFVIYTSVSQPPGPDISYTGPREVLLELIANLDVICIFVNMPHRTHNCTDTLYDYAIINY